MSTPRAAPLVGELRPLLEDLGVDPAALHVVPGEAAPSDPGDVLALLGTDATPRSDALLAEAEGALAGDGQLLVLVESRLGEGGIARLRNRLWPRFHLGGWYELSGGRARRVTLGGTEELSASGAPEGTLLFLRSREWVLSPAATAAKFDANAAGWDGDPSSPTYAHHRWMRRYVGRFAPTTGARRILDFGCGAGWVGIEAARAAPGAALRSFDPSPEMVRITSENAARSGVADFEGRVGFGEEPPFPAAGEERFDLVISSGVVSFSPDFEAWMRGLTGTVEPGGTLVVGDLNPRSRGMRRRRATKPLIPVRELNARTSGDVRAWLQRAGFRHEGTGGYQLTFPVPELAHLSARHLSGLLQVPLLGLNRVAAKLDRGLGGRLEGAFDSWVMHFTAPR
jgi:SAM-dependent methyltransferase